MSSDNDDSEPGTRSGLIGEEEGGEDVTPRQNLIAAMIIGAIALLAMILAALLQIPQNFYSAPGLLPFLAGLSLFCMAVGLGVMAVRDGGARDFLGQFATLRGFFEDVERRRTVLLFAIVTAYIVLVDRVAFEWRVPVGDFDLRFTGYELFSILSLALILRIFWRGPVPHCFAVSFGMVIALASVFRYVFRTLLPGLG